jgi:hypothetical protein
MTKRRLRLIASILILVALALIVVGLQSENTLLWSLGLVTLAVSMAISLATRWIGEGSG